MTATMRAALIHAFGKPLTLDTVPIPQPGPGQVLVHITASGICHTDLQLAQGDWPIKPTLPLIPGHEGIGTISATGAGVTTLKEGDWVGIPWLHSTCGVCEYCATGREALCPKQQNTGYTVNGTHAEYVLAEEAYVAHLPNTIHSAEAAPILCAGVTAYKGLKEAEVKAGEWVVIAGIGSLGHLAIQYAKAMGIHVAAVDVVEEKLSLAHTLGAEVTVNATYQNPVARVQHLIGGAHGAIITAASSQAFQYTISMLRRGGTCVLLGLPPGNVAVPIFDMVQKRLTLRGSINGSRRDLQEALQFVAEGKVHAEIELYPLSAINMALERLAQGQVLGSAVLQTAE
jgi:propanol-preferring alcohol dehydrogenase